jgi:hypothetical protein
VVFIARDSSLSSRRSNDRAGDDEWREDTSGSYIVILAEAEESADLGSTLGTEALGVDGVGDAGDVLLALLDDGESEDGQVHADDAAADRLALALTGAAGAVAGVAVGEEEADTGRVHDTLLHGETLLVVATSDAEDVALELITEVVTGDLSAHLLREKSQQNRMFVRVPAPVQISWVLVQSVHRHRVVHGRASRVGHDSGNSSRGFGEMRPFVTRDRGGGRSGRTLEVFLCGGGWRRWEGTGKTYALLHEVAKLTLILDIDQLLAAIGRVGDVQLHGGRSWA